VENGGHRRGDTGLINVNKAAPMTNTEVVSAIIGIVTDAMTYMLPIIAILAGINFMVSWLMSVTMGLGRRTFRG
jgi:hypothetical protein